MKNVDNKLFSRNETAELLNLSVRKIDSLRSTGELTCIKAGNRTLFHKADIDAYIQKNRGTPQTQYDSKRLLKDIGWGLVPVGITAIASLLFRE